MHGDVFETAQRIYAEIIQERSGGALKKKANDWVKCTQSGGWKLYNEEYFVWYNQ